MPHQKQRPKISLGPLRWGRLVQVQGSASYGLRVRIPSPPPFPTLPDSFAALYAASHIPISACSIFCFGLRRNTIDRCRKRTPIQCLPALHFLPNQPAQRFARILRPTLLHKLVEKCLHRWRQRHTEGCPFGHGTTLPISAKRCYLDSI